MFEDDVTVPAGWYPDPMGLPQLRWWNNHAWTELTTEARPPLVMQTPTRLAYADEELPTRRQQREQRERDEQYANLATDEDDARDAAAANAPLTVTLREIDAPISATATERSTSAGQTRSDTATPVHDDIDDDVADDSATERDHRPRPAFSPTEESVLGSPVFVGSVESIPNDPEPPLAGGGDRGERNVRTERQPGTEHFDELFSPRQATRPAAAPTPAGTAMEESDRERTGTGGPRSGASRSRLPIYTASVWVIALVPLLLLVLSLLLLLGFGASLGSWVTPGIWGSSYLLVVGLAIADRAALARSGYEHPASWGWALLTAPVYLLARSMSLAKVGPLGFAPVLVWAALGVLQVGSALVVPGLVISAMPQTFLAQAEQSVVSDASIIGAKLAVTCSPSLPVVIGQTFSCRATGEAKDVYDLTVSLRRTNGWVSWHVDDWGYLHGAPVK